VSAKDFACDFVLVPLADLVDSENSEEIVPCISKGGITGKANRLLLIDRQSDRYRK
jgi:hypothetical protein